MTSIEQMVARTEAWSRPCIRLVPVASETGSFLGGEPRLGTLESWPSWKGRPLGFLGQIDLSEASEVWLPEWMPSLGRLLFFYSAEQETWGFDPADRGSWRVLHLNDTEGDTGPPGGIPEYAQFARRHIGFRKSLSLPSWERVVLPDDNIQNDEELWNGLSTYLDSAESRVVGTNPAHQLFGLPAPQQADAMELECQLASNGLYVGNPTGYKDPRRKELEPGARDWVLLFQLDTDDDAGMMWGDVGMLYFWIRRQDAQRADFSNVWMVLQCG